MKKGTNKEKVKYIYILSQRYSGSTLLSFLLATHPDVSTIGERRKFYNKSIKSKELLHHKARHCSCGERFENCNYLNSIKDRVLAQVSQSELSTNTTEFNIYNNKYFNRVAYEIIKFCLINNIPLSFTPFNKKIKELCRFNQILAKEILALDGSKVFLDTSKIINHALFLSLVKDFDFHVIWLVRDPRAQINSALKYNKWKVEDAAGYWKKEMVDMENVLRGLDLKFMKLRYEDLCKSTEEELVKIFNFVGLDESTFSLDFRREPRHIIGNASMRLGKDSTITERKEWKKQLSKEQIETIEKLTADYQHLYSV